MPLIEVKCPNCGATLKASGIGRYSCPYCGSVYRDEAVDSSDTVSYVPRHAKPELSRQNAPQRVKASASLEETRSFDELYHESSRREDREDALYNKLKEIGLTEYLHLGKSDKRSLNNFMKPDPVVYLSDYQRQMVADAMKMLPKTKWKSPKEHLSAKEIDLPLLNNEYGKNTFLTYNSENVFRYHITDFDVPTKYLRFAYTYPASQNRAEVKNLIADTYNRVAQGLQPYTLGEQAYVMLPYNYADPYDETPSFGVIDLFLYADGSVWAQLPKEKIERFSDHFKKYLSDFLISTVKNNQSGDYDEYAERRKRREAENSKFQRQMERSTNADRRMLGLCQYCGGSFGQFLFGKKCLRCGKKKDY